MASAVKEKLEKVDSAWEKVSKKQKTSHTKLVSAIDQLISDVSNCKTLLDPDAMETGNETTVGQALGMLQKKVQEAGVLKKVQQEHKDYHALLSKLGKLIDKSFPEDAAAAIASPVEFERDALNAVIAQHFYHQGQFDIGNLFIKEAQLSVDQQQSMQPFIDMYRLVDCIANATDLLAAVRWVQARRAQLKDGGRGLEFKLHTLHYVSLLRQRQPLEALTYARANFPAFAGTPHMPAVQRLMAALMFVDTGLDRSPYADLLAPSLAREASTEFIVACCSGVLHTSCESPLFTAVTAGELALPRLLKLMSIVAEKAGGGGGQGGLSSQQQPFSNSSGAGSKQRLFSSLLVEAVEVELLPEFNYHPIFACPVSKEQTTPENPPMLLVCGHVISRVSMLKIAKGSSRFKCPYCPTEQSTSRATAVTF